MIAVIRFRRYVLGIWWQRLPDNLCEWVAQHLPRRVAYFAFVRVTAEASTTKLAHREMGTITCQEALDSWD